MLIDGVNPAGIPSNNPESMGESMGIRPGPGRLTAVTKSSPTLDMAALEIVA
jgi:hypothetical protein